MGKWYKFVVIAFFLLLGGFLWKTETVRDWISDITFPWRFGIQKKSNIMVTMRDGIHLNTQLLKPVNSNFPLPVILIRTTYGGISSRWPFFFVKQGYAVVIQQVRGTYRSEGRYHTHRYSRCDGYDTIEWIVKQDWSNGKVGTFGCSYLGEAQSILAAARHPNHIAMITDGGGGAIGSAMGSYGYFGVFENGVLNLASALGWYTENGAVNQSAAKLPTDIGTRLKNSIDKLPVVSLARQVVSYETGFDDLVSHSLTDDWWLGEGYITNSDTFSAAGLHVNTWFDQTVHDTFRLAQLMEENAINSRALHQHLLIGPGPHCSSGSLETGQLKVGDLKLDYQDIDYESIYLNWFDYWLKEKPLELPPRYMYYRLRSSKWAASDKWPPTVTAPIKFYLSLSQRSERKGGVLKPDPPSEQNEDRYVYNPENPVPTLGGSICCTGRDEEISGPVDQRPIEARPDVLIYRSKALEKDLELAGNVTVVLYVSTDAPDTDFTVKLIDQFPDDGKALGLQDGVVRMRYREGIKAPRPAQPDKVYKVAIVLRPIAYRFEAGHQIAIHISSSNFPRLARNLNTGEHEYQDERMQKAENHVYHDTLRPSFIELPVLH